MFPSLVDSYTLITKRETVLCSSAKNFGSALEELHSLNRPVNCLDSVISPLIDVARLEVEILANLLKLQCQIGNLEFLNSILTLSFVSQKLGDYCAGGYLTSAQSLSTALSAWLRRFYSVLLAKFSLYWYSILHDVNTNFAEIGQILVQERPDIVIQIQEFIIKHEGASVSIFFDAYLQDFAFLGHSYVPPGAAEMYAKSPVSIPCIFTMPLTELNTLPVSDYAVIMRSVHSLLSLDASIIPRTTNRLHEAQLQKTFFVLKLETRVYLAIVVADEAGRQKENTHIRDFITKLSDYIQMVDLTRSLQRPH